jgi:hypothetical protein
MAVKKNTAVLVLQTEFPFAVLKIRQNETLAINASFHHLRRFTHIIISSDKKHLAPVRMLLFCTQKKEF